MVHLMKIWFRKSLLSPAVIGRQSENFRTNYRKNKEIDAKNSSNTKTNTKESDILKSRDPNLLYLHPVLEDMGKTQFSRKVKGNFLLLKLEITLSAIVT